MPKAESISKADRAVIKRLSRTHVEQTLAKLNPHLAQSRWLARTNRYSNNTIERLRLDSKAGATIQGKHLAQYISASSILHCADGWSYLGRAINCLLKGDPHRVVHLAYYAELRAALSLLACEGIGVFKKVHFAINAPEGAQAFPSRPATHVAAWNYLKYWGSLKRSGDLFADVVRPGGMPLTTWFEGLSGVEQFVRPKARAWFGQWSMDLGLFAEDREARNESSYRPDGIPKPWYVSGNDALALATELWEACEPSSSSLFEGIDRFILRLTVESAFTGAHNIAPAADPARFGEFAGGIVDRLSFDPNVAAEWKLFLTRQNMPDDPKLFAYSRETPLNEVTGHSAVLARAMLLLRLATGSALKLIRSAGLSGGELEFWWGKLGINRGLWNGAKDSSELLDLWDDITVLFEDIRTFQENTPVIEQTFQTISRKIPHVVAGLGGCERVAIWSLTP